MRLVLFLWDVEETPYRAGPGNVFLHYDEPVAWNLVRTAFRNKTGRNITCASEREETLFPGRGQEAQADERLQAW